MSVLAGTEFNPGIVGSSLSRVDFRKEASKEQIKYLDEAVARWKVIQGTRTYQIISQLVDPEIKALNAELAKPDDQYDPSLSLERIHERRAEIRGELRVWNTVKYLPLSLEKMLQELNKEESKEKELSEKDRKVIAKYS